MSESVIHAIISSGLCVSFVVVWILVNMFLDRKGTPKIVWTPRGENISFGLPHHFIPVVEMLCQRNKKESGTLWTHDELCKRLVCELLRMERDKSPDFKKEVSDE
jgi:hypothetical protein